MSSAAIACMADTRTNAAYATTFEEDMLYQAFHHPPTEFVRFPVLGFRGLVQKVPVQTGKGCVSALSKSGEVHTAR
eukprot:3119981-Rhodomonas_salina.1